MILYVAPVSIVSLWAGFQTTKVLLLELNTGKTENLRLSVLWPYKVGEAKGSGSHTKGNVLQFNIEQAHRHIKMLYLFSKQLLYCGCFHKILVDLSRQL